jgi:hypothetical protein
MNRLRRSYVLICLCLAVALAMAPLHGQAPPEKVAGEKPPEKWLVDRDVTVSPARAPVPALRYRLYPSFTERKEGNAVPIYLRFAHERNDARKRQIREKPEEWNKLPLDKLPLDEIKKEFLGGYKYNYKQLELGARRKTADWSYTLDVEDRIGILLPDAQEMRMQAPLLVLKARVEMAEHHYDDAVHTLETGFSFSQQVSEGPFLINSLVGIAIARQIEDCVLELMERPDAPNLYWALAVIPRPLIDLRNQDEIEQVLLEKQFPDLAELDRPRGPEHWDAALRRVRLEVERISRMEREPVVKAETGSNDPADKSPDLPAARKYLAEVAGLPADKIDSMPPAQTLLLYLTHYYHEMRDEVFKTTYLPYPEAQPQYREVEQRVKAAPDTEAGRIVRMLLPAVTKVQGAQVRNERILAALRTIEALRMHAAAHNGDLPEKLADVKIVPVPNDPGTGQSFEYHRAGATATLRSRLPDQPLASTGLRYRVTIRK